MKETFKAMLFATFPLFIAFAIGSMVGSTLAFRQVIEDCTAMTKFRYGKTVMNCAPSYERVAK